jgi:hypothetical protein
MANHKAYKSLCLIFCLQLNFIPLIHAEDNFVKLNGDFRSYFFQRDFKAGTTDKESLAFGGILRVRLSPLPHLTAGLSLYTSQGAGFNDEDKAVYNLLAQDAAGNHKNYTALGEGFIEIYNTSLSLKLGRQEMFTPWLNLHDVRMTPQSFDAASLIWRLNEAMFVQLCHVVGMKYKTDTAAKSMSELAGFAGDEPVSCLGLENRGEVDLKLWAYRAHEMWDDLYLRVDYHPDEGNWHIGGRYLNRNTRGTQLAGNQDTWHIGIHGGITLGGLELNTAYARNGSRDILRKWGHETTISNQVMVADRAREEAWLMGLNYKPPSNQKVQLRFSVASHNTPDRGRYGSPDRKEYNLGLNYNLDEFIPGMNLRWRFAWVDERGNNAEDLHDLRFYLRYQHVFI